MIKSIDETIPFSRRYHNQTIRQIIRSDSGYLKDLFVKDERLFFSRECFAEICRLTKEHRDNWENPHFSNKYSVFSSLKTYAVPYLYNFNQEELLQLNEKRIILHQAKISP